MVAISIGHPVSQLEKEEMGLLSNEVSQMEGVAVSTSETLRISLGINSKMLVPLSRVGKHTLRAQQTRQVGFN